MSSKSSQSKSSRHSSSTTKASSHPYASYTASHEEKAYYTYANTYSSNYSYSHSSNSDVSSWHLPDAIDIEDEDITFDGQPLSALFEGSMWALAFQLTAHGRETRQKLEKIREMKTPALWPRAQL
jgi:hypothetical protein